MSTTIIEALPGEKVLHANTLGVVTPHCVVVASADHRQTVLAVSRLSRIRRITISYPILLVIAAVSLLLSLAAFASKEGGGAGPPFAIFGAFLLAGFFLSRRGAVSFTVDGEVFESNLGSLSEAKNLISAVELARERYNG